MLAVRSDNSRNSSNEVAKLYVGTARGPPSEVAPTGNSSRCAWTGTVS
jgi:hypothetical protein